MNLRNKLVSLATVLLAMSPLSLYAIDTADATITTKIKALFALEADTKSFDIHVTTTDQIVNLSGTVDTQLQANHAVEIAQSVKGVKDVNDSKLNVTSSTSFLDDAYTTARVKGKISQLESTGKISNNNDLHVETTNGVVHVLGKVGNNKDVSVIEQEVKKMNGVKDVKTNIDVMKS